MTGGGGAAQIGRPMPARFAAPVLAEQVAFIYRTVLNQVVINPVMGAMMVWLLSGIHPLPSLLGWYAALVLISVLRVIVWRRYTARPADRMPAESHFWGRLFTLISLFNGVLWGALVYLFFNPAHFVESMVLIIAVAGFTAGSFAAYSAYLPAYIGFAAPAIGLVAARLLLEGGAAYGVLTSMCVIFALVLLAYARAGQGQIRAAIVAQLEMAELNASLVEQQRALSEAKEAAESANRAKSKFLASASHDLRQPMHALRLFVDLLATRNQQAEIAPVIAKVTMTVDALEELFSKLLELAQADLGRVDVEPRPLALGRTLKQLAVEHGAAAAAKGIALRVRPTTAVVRTDPILLERILRNIVTNAIRYTHAGGILVGCRAAGDAVRIEIWDSGIGIPPEELRRVFDEFHQVENPERDRTKGLGLGLAIVERLSQLLGIRIGLKSRVGRGSCFSLELPRAARAEIAEAEVVRDVDPTPKATIDGLEVVFVDDEPAILTATADLLRRWGCAVTAGASLAEVMAALTQRGTLPQLIITDYRLRDGRTGDEVVTAMRALARRPLPAVILTGDTLLRKEAVGPDGAAADALLLVLYKPLRPARLRAAIEHLLAATPASACDLARAEHAADV